MRETGNLKQVQHLLGHSKIETTTKYAHVLLEDLRAGMEAVSARRSQTHENPHDRIDRTEEGQELLGKEA